MSQHEKDFMFQGLIQQNELALSNYSILETPNTLEEIFLML
jgi:hypothetical protein